LALALAVAVEAPAQAPVHPLDPIMPEEYAAIVEVLLREERIDDDSRLPRIQLREPPKRDVLAWRPGAPFQREALVVVKKGPQVFEAAIDLREKLILEWTERPGVQPNLFPDEFNRAIDLTKAHPGWREAMRRRGFDTFEGVALMVLSAGEIGRENERGRRLARVVAHDGREVGNVYGRPIEGLVAVVDLNANEIVELIDAGETPISRAPVDIEALTPGPPRAALPETIAVKPNGHGFTMDGRVVTWDKWRFHFRFDARVGPIVSLATFAEGPADRSVLYQGSLAEMVVVYMDPSEGWCFRSSMDAGEFGVGRSSSALIPGVDCPDHASLFDAIVADEWGRPFLLPRAIALFEREPGEPLWRHAEAWTRSVESRPRRELVLRSISAVGNDDYIFDWVFQRDGALRVSVAAGGAPLARGDRSRRDVAPGERPYGRLVEENLVAVNHDHFFSFRLDLDVDGEINSFVVDELRATRPRHASPRTSVWVAEPRILSGELEARLRRDPARPAIWRAINASRIGRSGRPVGYELRLPDPAAALVDPDDPAAARAGFAQQHLWVTPYSAAERYSAGDYPNQGPPDQGLPTWTARDRSIQDVDIVLWPTIGFHHVARTEDWPVQSFVRRGFELRPFDFFDRNPALDLVDRR
jgi:primary-amine oxidase